MITFCPGCWIPPLLTAAYTAVNELSICSASAVAFVSTGTTASDMGAACTTTISRLTGISMRNCQFTGFICLCDTWSRVDAQLSLGLTSALLLKEGYEASLFSHPGNDQPAITGGSPAIWPRNGNTGKPPDTLPAHPDRPGSPGNSWW